MTSALQYMQITGPRGDCQELWNQARLDAYLNAGLVPAGFTVDVPVGDGLASMLADPVPPVYTDPQFDDAPWWDDHPHNSPRAARFAGILPLEVLGLDDDTSTVDVVGTADGGAVFANRRDTPREVQVKALLVGQDCCATRHGLQWLKDTLADMACGPSELRWLACLPGELAGVGTELTLAMRYEDGSVMEYADGSPMMLTSGPGGPVTPVPMLYADGTPQLYDDGTPMFYEGEPDVGPYGNIPAGDWWRVLAGVAPTAPVRVTDSIGLDCGCGGAPILVVEFGFTAAVATPWRLPHPAQLDVPFTAAPIRPTYRFRKRPRTTRQVEQHRARREYQIVLRGNRWCPVGDWVWQDIQQGGGDGYVTVQEAVASNSKEWTPTQPCRTADCKTRWVRLILDENAGTSYFETIRWTNRSWNQPDPLSSIPCDCEIKVLELVRTNMDTTVNPAVPKTVISSPGDGEDCCYVGLSWTATTVGNWSAIPAPDQLPEAPRLEWGSELAARPFKSGWPPPGCNIVIARNCPPEAPPADDCPASVDCAVYLNSDGTWSDGPVYGNFNPDVFPQTACRFVVGEQTQDPILETVTETVYGQCVESCFEPDALADPAIVMARPPVPPILSNAQCMPATSRELRMAWSEYRTWDSVVPIIEFYSGATEVLGVEILVWANPLGVDPNLETSSTAFADCNACGAWQLSRVPAGTTILIDSRTRTVTARLQGGRAVNANRIVGSRAGRAQAWPTIVSCGLVAAIRAPRTALDVNTATGSLWVAGVGN